MVGAAECKRAELEATSAEEQFMLDQWSHTRTAASQAGTDQVAVYFSLRCHNAVRRWLRRWLSHVLFVGCLGSVFVHVVIIGCSSMHGSSTFDLLMASPRKLRPRGPMSCCVSIQRSSNEAGGSSTARVSSPLFVPSHGFLYTGSVEIAMLQSRWYYCFTEPVVAHGRR